jgi:hypothetical protein
MVTRAPRENKRPAIPGPSSMISTGAPSLTGYLRGRAGTARRVVVGAGLCEDGAFGDAVACADTAFFCADAAFFCADTAFFCADTAIFGVTLLGAVMVSAPYKCVVTCVSCVPVHPDQLIGEPGVLA